MEPRLRNILWDASGAPIRRSEPFDTSSIFTSSTVPLQQLLEPLPPIAIDPALENTISDVRRDGTTYIERTRLQPLVDWLNDAEWPGGRDLDSDSVVLPPIQQASAHESNAAPAPAARGAPLAEVLNAMSPLATARDVETLRIKELRFIVEAAGKLAGNHNRDMDNGDSTTPNSKRRRVEAESTRTLPRPARKSSRRQKMPALLPPLLAPLHNPPVDARVVPSMTTDGLPRMPELKSPLPFPATTTERETNQDNQLPSTRPEDDREEPARNDKSDGRKATSKASSQKKVVVTLPNEKRQIDPKSASSTSKKETTKRVKWTADETQYLIDGVERFGIGSWKKILECKDYHFKGERNSIDLKDRFRTCFPDEYRRSGSQRGKVDSVLDSAGVRRGRGGRTRVELQRMGVQEHIPFPKQDRRQRKHFTKAEDDALLRGFLKYPAQWKKIQMDSSLGLQHRTRTDLRDRFRNRYPQRFKEAGYVHKAKQGTPPATTALEDEDYSSSKDDDETTNPTSLPCRPADAIDLHNLLGSAASQACTSLLAPLPASSKDEQSHTLRLLAGGFVDSYTSTNNTFSAMSVDDDDDDDSVAGIQLNRAIFDWADQNKLNMAAAQGGPPAGNGGAAALRDGSSNVMRIDPLLLHATANGTSGPTVTLPGGMGAAGDKPAGAEQQGHVNPLEVAEKLPGLAGLVAGQAAVGAASVPLSRILNGG